MFLDAHTKDTNYIDALCNYAHISVKFRDYDRARKILLEKKKSGYNAKIYEALARIYFLKGDIDRRSKTFKEIDQNNELTKLQHLTY